MPDITKLNALIEPLITLAIPAMILMILSVTVLLGVVKTLLLALAFPLVWSMRDVIRRKKLNLFAVKGMLSALLTGSVGCLLHTQFKPQTEPQTAFAIAAG